MASQLDSTPFNPDAGLRESFLYQLRPQERKILVDLAQTILELAREGHCVDEYPEPPVFAHISALAMDMRFQALLIRHVSSYQDQASTDLWHARLLVCLNRIGPELERLVAELESELKAVAPEALKE